MNSENRLLISVVMPTYNRAGLVSRAINSVLAQTYPNWELIIVDDGSTDNTGELLKLSLEDKRVKYFRKENTGAAHSRNYGVNYASGEWLMFLDSDDELVKDTLAAVAKSIDSTTSELLFGKGIIIENGVEKDYEVKLPANPTLGLLTQNFVRNLPAIVISKRLFLEVEGFDIQFPARQDIDLYYRAAKRTGIAYIETTLCKIYLDHDGRISGNNNNRLIGSLMFFKKHKNDMSFKQKSANAKRIVRYALGFNNLIALKYLPLAIYAIVLKVPIAPK